MLSHGSRGELAGTVVRAGAGTLAAVVLAFFTLTAPHGLDRDRPECGGVGVEAEDDLAATLLDERREPVGKGEGAFGARAEGLPAGLGSILRGVRGLALD